MPKAEPSHEPILFYRLASVWNSGGSEALSRIAKRSPEHKVEHWSPSLTEPRPSGSKDAVYLAYSAINALALFPNRHYGAIAIRDANGTLCHTSMVVPPSPRFPFMGKDDVQIGATWTNPVARGHGLATRALLEAARLYADGQRSLWYLCAATNLASQKVAKNAGFACIGRGRKVPRLGLRVLGFYAVTAPLERDG